MEVGVRELKARLSHYLTRVQAGDEVVVTDRGRPVATLIPYGGSTLEHGIEQGWADAPRRSRPGSAPRLQSSRSVRDVLDEDRG